MQNAGEVINLIVRDLVVLCCARDRKKHNLNIPMQCQIHAGFGTLDSGLINPTALRKSWAGMNQSSETGHKLNPRLSD